MQSDIESVAEEMAESFAANDQYEPATGHLLTALQSNDSPHSVKTEREVATEKKGLPVFKMLFLRKWNIYIYIHMK